MLRTDIGEGAAALLCTTNSTTCCTISTGMRIGAFYFPNGAYVPIPAGRLPYYSIRGTSMISLHRRYTTAQTGKFRCEIPDASGILVNLFINIGIIYLLLLLLL